MQWHCLIFTAALASLALAGHSFAQPAGPAADIDPGYAAWLKTEIASLPGKPKVVLETGNLSGFSRPGDGQIGSTTVVDVSGQPFRRAVRVVVNKRLSPAYLMTLHSPKSTGPVRKGDVLLLTYYVRCEQAASESGEGWGNGNLEHTGEPWFGIGGISTGGTKQWQKRQFRVRSEHDFPAGGLWFAIHLGQYPQTVEFAAVTVFNFGPDQDLKALPFSAVTYAGREPDAPWRKAAAERIEKHRKGDLLVKVVDAAGMPIAGASVHARMTRHAYQFGTFLEEPTLAQTPDGEKYRQTVLKLFNRATVPTYWADWGWESPDSRERYLALAEWAKANKLHTRGHNLIWPSWQWTPTWLRKLENEPNALRNAVRGSIAERVAVFRQFEFDDYDVINEQRDNHALIDILGPDIVLEWFRTAHALDPKTRLGVNEYNIVAGGGSTDQQQEIYMKQIDHLLANKIPLGLIGFQCHIGENATPPQKVYDIVDRFAKYGLPLHATEFDIATDDEQMQGDYMRDFLTAFFSHPSTEAITQWGFWEGQHWIPRGALFRKDWTPKPSGQAYMDLVLGDWWTDVTGQTAADGSYAVRGFLGDYEIVVTANGKTQSVPGTLARDGTTIQVVVP